MHAFRPNIKLTTDENGLAQRVAKANIAVPIISENVIRMERVYKVRYQIVKEGTIS